MKIELVAYTQANPALNQETAQVVGDLATIWNGQGTYAENVVEFAGRVCYRSTHRMGTAPDFIVARVREGHEDIIEHIVVTVRVTGSDEPLRWRMFNRHCEVSESPDWPYDQHGVVSSKIWAHPGLQAGVSRLWRCLRPATNHRRMD